MIADLVTFGRFSILRRWAVNYLRRALGFTVVERRLRTAEIRLSAALQRIIVLEKNIRVMDGKTKRLTFGWES